MWNTKRDRLIVGTFWAFAGMLFIIAKLGIGPVVLPMLKANENNPTAYYNRGNRYLFSDPGYAITYYSHALDLDPTYTEALYQRAIAYSRVDNPDEALADMDRAVALAPDEARYVFARANLHKNAGNLDAALQDYDRALRLDPEYAVVYYNRANTYYETGQKDAALRDYLSFLDRHKVRDQIYQFASLRVEELSGTG